MKTDTLTDAGTNTIIDTVILGAGGYTGQELLRLLQNHPHLNPVHISSDTYAGKTIEDVFPGLKKSRLVFKKHIEAVPKDLPVFLALPDKASLKKVPELLAQGNPLVDLSGAFRLHNKKIWEKNYNLEHTAFEKVDSLIYGLPELFREEIKKTKAVSNPGCYPTSALLPLLPVLTSGLGSQLISIDIQACSGVSGAGGRVEGQGFSFSNVYENFRAYKVLKHQHEPEIEEYAAKSCGQKLPFPITFIPHLLPIQRGILATIIFHWKAEAPPDIEGLFYRFSQKEKFIRFYKSPEEVELSRVQNTNYLDMAVRSRGSVSAVISALDNLVKGAAGQAVQNMNLMLGFSEESGLL